MKRQRGVTMVELVLVILIIGIIGASAAVFLKNPISGYVDTGRRAQMTDAADTAARRMLRELQYALPNSIRIATAGANSFLEFVPIDDVGRYRRATSGGNEPTGTDPLDVNDATDTSFQVLSRPVTVQASEQLVVFNLGVAPYDVYAGDNRRAVLTAPGSAQTISFSGTGVALGADSPTSRFYLVRTPVTFACLPAADGTGRILRISGYALQAAQPTNVNAAPLAGASSFVQLDKVTACSLAFNATLANANAIALAVQITDSGETVTLQTQAYLPNTP